MNGRWYAALHAALHAALACCLLFLAALRCEAQGNLVPNPSFETVDSCPFSSGFLYSSKPLHWERWNQSPDYFHSCAGDQGGIDTLIDIPQNGFGYQDTWDGDAYVGMFTYGLSAEYREYVGCQLLQPLTVGQTYYLSCRSNLAMHGTYWDTSWASNNLGLLFTMQPNIWDGVNNYPFSSRNYAHLVDPVVNTDSAGWTLVTGTFVADSAYPYLVIGNFFDDLHSDTLDMAPGNSLGAYYFVDSIRVCNNPSCQGETGLGTIGRMPAVSGPNPANDVFLVTTPSMQEFDWALFEAAGRLVAEGSSRTGDVLVPVFDRPEGHYSLLIRGEMGEEHLKFVVMH